jgi:hypothetical protein
VIKKNYAIIAHDYSLLWRFEYLGINDLFLRNDIGAEEIAAEIGYAVELIQSKIKQRQRGTEMILLSPLPVNLPKEESAMYRLQLIKSESLFEEYRKAAD